MVHHPDRMPVSSRPPQREPLAPEEAAPILRGTFGEMAALQFFFKKYASRLVALASRRAPRDRASRDAFANDIVGELASKVMRGLGLARPQPMPSDLWPWLATVIDRLAIDQLRRAKRVLADTDAFDERCPPASSVSALSANSDPVPAGPDDRLERARAIFDHDAFPPNYRLALFAWLLLSALERRHLEAAATQVNRSRTGKTTGLVRAVPDAWRLVVPLASEWPNGIAGRGAEQERFAWIVRSDLGDFEAFQRDTATAKAARELIGQWYRRGRRDLEERIKAMPAEVE